MKISYEQNKLLLIALVVIALLIVSSILFIVFFTDVDDVVDIEEPEGISRPENYTVLMTMTWEEMQSMDLPSDFPIDDRVNPNLDEQAIFCEIVRIRARGIEEYMRKLGFEWRTPPSFYYVIQLHDTEHMSRVFSMWDTEFIRQEVFRRVDDGLETADVAIRIFEEQSVGFLGFRSDFVEVESISLTYCFRTGRWTGDNYFGHPDGYGRFLGDEFELWFRLRQSTFDSDGIPCWVENNLLMTDPLIHDSDIDHSGDGIPTYWEWYWGFDPFNYSNHSGLDISKDGLSNIDKFNLRSWHADPYQPEIYIEVDFMKGRPFGPDFVLFDESKQLLVDKFSQRKYHLTPWASKITVLIDDGHMGGGGELIPHIRGHYNYWEGIISEFYKNNFADERKGVFRYLVIGDGSYVGKIVSGGWTQPQDHKGWYDTMWIGGSQLAFMAYYRGFNVRPKLQRLVQAIQVMHELGHTLGMVPGDPDPILEESILGYTQYPGIDNASMGAIRYWSNYQSCMNYHMMYRPFVMRFFGKNYGLVLDYSDGSRDEPNHPDRNDWEVIDLRFFKQQVYIGGLE
ncbi:MAG: hypothetical protein QCI00_08505 [Candidatus Thermoplasmatota archaeon]|nr:hypothetical protein [Candidatus Thermoplasmatota archaeon]